MKTTAVIQAGAYSDSHQGDSTWGVSDAQALNALKVESPGVVGMW